MRFNPIFCLLLAGGCALPQESILPPFEEPASWKGPLNDLEMVEPTRCWWTLFDDTILDELVERAIQQNPDLLVACERIEEARAIEGILFSNLFPKVNTTPLIQKEGRLFDLSQFGAGEGNRRGEISTFSFPLNLQYEFDFWGKFRYGDKAAKQRFLASEFAYESVYNILTSDVARLYFELRTLDEEIRFLKETVKIRSLLVEVNQKRSEGGIDPELDLQRALLELNLADGSLAEAMRLRKLAENGLALLMGEPASCFSLGEGLLPEFVPLPCPGLPSELLLRRPDLKERYVKIQAAYYEVGVAQANFFPSFSLTGVLGTLSPQFSQWFGEGSRYWSYGLNALQEIFTGGRLTSEKEAALARFRQEKWLYKGQVMTAFREVEDALIEIEARKNQAEIQEKAVVHASLTALLARNQYEAGLINYLHVADAEKTELDIRKQAIVLKGTQFLAAVSLIKALGGGWD